jgi:hypothetical protein
MTFRVQDTTTICIDTCSWSAYEYLTFHKYEAAPYVPRENMPYCFSLSYDSHTVGDVNKDGALDLGDVIYLLNYLYKAGPVPEPLWTGDCNCDGSVELGDVIYLLNYLFKGGDPPAC